MVTANNSIVRVALGTALLLLIPFGGMHLSHEVNWTAFDFLVLGALLFSFGLMLDLAWRKMGTHRIAAVLATAAFFLWLWAELAVGVFTNWGS